MTCLSINNKLRPRISLLCASVLGLISLTTPIAAQTLSSEEAALLPRLVDSICIEGLHETNGCETAVLLLEEEFGSTADLVIFTDRRSKDGSQPIAVARSIASNGSMFGMSPSLEEGPNGSLFLHSEQIGMGRSPWEKTLTIVFRDDMFVVAGFTYSTYDRIDATNLSCDLNLRTGEYVIIANDQEHRGKTEPQHVPVTHWDAFDSFPEICGYHFRETND